MIKIVYDIKGLMIVCHCDSSLNKINVQLIIIIIGFIRTISKILLYQITIFLYYANYRKNKRKCNFSYMIVFFYVLIHN